MTNLVQGLAKRDHSELEINRIKSEPEVILYIVGTKKNIDSRSRGVLLS